MSTSSILKAECPVCHKVAVEASRFQIGVTKLITLACGHLITSEIVTAAEDEYSSITFADGAKPRPYQIECIKFAQQANFNLIIADEQGLGKTIEALCMIKLFPHLLLPAVIVCPTSVKLQWLWEIDRICIPDKTLEQRQRFLTQVIQSGKEKAAPGFQIYVVTFDMLKKEDMFEYVPNIRTIIIDECQRIKNHLSDRAKAVQRISKKTENHIPMSGTPIKNNAGEYYTVLNLVAPSRFPQYQRYLDTYCDTYENGWSVKVGGLKDMQRFHEDTKDIIIRRTKAEVLADLPTKDRKFYHVDLDPRLNKDYAKALEELEDIFYGEDGNSFAAGAAKIAIMGKLRHITGLSKIEQCVDFVTEFLLSTDRKITVFTHHQDVMELLELKLNSWLSDGGFEPLCKLHSGLDGDERASLVEKFKTTNSRVMLASTLAAGEGLNLQFCSDSVMLERQWNPANEEQAEDRFHRFGQNHSVTITYIIAIGTIDEYFTELVESKRAIVSATLDKKEIEWEQNSLMKELAEVLLTKGRERWRL